ncbi:MAG: 50S ribosomal protein L5 [Planctomycetes bacterium]|nr:50S ribosomal protein L5 [Planctomycetota bacterium]
MARLLERYKEELQPALAEEFGIKNRLAIPRLSKVVVSMGVGKNVLEKKRLEAAMNDLGRITGQKPAVCRAKKSVSNFKTRKGYEIGCKVTLRGRRMFEFVDRLINAAVPRTRDFRGLDPGSFDGHGNYSMGIVEQIIFPEVNIDKLEYTQGMNITFVTTAKNDDHARRLLTLMGMPFRTAGAE